MSDVPCFIGIDVAKAQLDIALRPSGERWAVPNDASGVATLVDRVQTLHPTLIVLEATGGLERVVTSALAQQFSFWLSAGIKRRWEIKAPEHEIDQVIPTVKNQVAG